jgi:hypothetical protein
MEGALGIRSEIALAAGNQAGRKSAEKQDDQEMAKPKWEISVQDA